jgi:type VI secretion system secreted protein VgrG
MALQLAKPFVFHSPLGDELLFLEMRGSEQLGRTFSFTVRLLSRNPDITLADLVGQPVAVSVDLAPYQVQPRYFHGYVIHFQREGKLGDYFVYSAHLAPWLWLLTYAADCRIFQQMTVPDILKTVFRGHGFTDLKDALTMSYPTREYVTQYDETDLEFVSRLMEDAGIYYFFEHEEQKHTLVLADSYSAHQKPSGYEIVPLLETKTTSSATSDYLDHWSRWSDLQPGGVVLTDFDFEKPSLGLETKRLAPNPHGMADFEIYRHPGVYTDRTAGEDICIRRLEEFHARYEQMGGSGNVRGLGVGNLFDLLLPPPLASKTEYLVDYASYELRVGGYETSGTEQSENVFRFQFTVLDAKRQFRPERRFKAKRMPGPQTATVVGKAGEEIWTDKYGRVKVQFHWDREGQRDENSSCWVRVAQVWAGKQWGAIHIPRIGQEVIVDFLDGNPDRPIVTGRVYNADNMPPYALPDNKTQSGIKSRSSKGGSASNFNEIRFEDLKGKEQLNIQAEKDMATLVKNNQSTSVGADRSVSVGGNHSVSVNGTQSTTVTKDETQTYKAKRTMKVTGKNDDEVTDTHTANYKNTRTETVKAPDNLTVNGGDKTITVHGKFDNTVDTEFKVTKAGTSMTITDDFVMSASGKMAMSNPGTSVTGEGTKLSLSGNTEISITCGAASITLKSDGTIEITGTTVKVGNASNNAAFEPAGTTINGVMITSSATGIHQISGALVKVG